MQACLNTLRAGLIASRVDLIWQMYPGVIAGPLVIGSIAGTGGRFAIDPVLGGFGALEGECWGPVLACAVCVWEVTDGQWRACQPTHIRD